MCIRDRPRDVHDSEMTLGSLKVRYLDQDAHRLQQLILQTHGLTSRLAVLASKPAHLMLRLHGGFYEPVSYTPLDVYKRQAMPVAYR